MPTPHPDPFTFSRRHPFLIGIDSDGCVFDTMEAKQSRFFHPVTIEKWHLEPVEAAVRETADFVALHSVHRGINRFQALLQIFEWLPRHPDIAGADGALPPTGSLRAFVSSGLPLGNETLAAEARRSGDPELQRILDWSKTIDHRIATGLEPIPPFPGVREALTAMAPQADLVVVSQTPVATITREWQAHGIAPFVRGIAGQEHGPKTSHLDRARGDAIPPSRVLMIGDAPGDRRAAAATGCRFFPILPGREPESWSHLTREVLPRFFADAYDLRQEQALVREFEALLPAAPPWQEASSSPPKSHTP